MANAPAMEVTSVQVIGWWWFGYRVRSVVKTRLRAAHHRGIVQRDADGAVVESGVFLRRRAAERRAEQIRRDYQVAGA